MFFPETNGYRIALDETECMSFWIKEFLEKCNETFEKQYNGNKKIHLVIKKRSYFITGDIEICSEDSDSDKKTERKKIKCINLLGKKTRIIL